MEINKQIYLDTKSGVRFTITNIVGSQFKINPLNLMELGLTSFTEFISLQELNRLIKEKIIEREV